MKKINTQSPKRAYQAIFVSLAFSYIITLIWSIWYAWKLYDMASPQQGYNQFSFVLALIMAVIPLVYFVISYVVIKGETWVRLYRAAVLTLGSVLILMSIKTLFYVFGYYLIDMNIILWQIKMEAVPTMLGLVPFIVVVLKLRQQSTKKTNQLEKYMLVVGVSTFLAITVVQSIYFSIAGASLVDLLGLALLAVVCALLFLPVYLQDRIRSRFERLFRALLVSATVSYVWVAVSYVIPMQISDYLSYVSIFAAVAALVAGCLVLGYLYLRRLIRTLPQ